MLKPKFTSCKIKSRKKTNEKNKKTYKINY